MRNIAIGRFRRNNADKRIPSELLTSLDELEECIPGENSVDAERATRELAKILNQAICEMKDREQYIFICRYYYADKISAIANSLGISENSVYRILAKIRGDIKARLDAAGYSI